MSTVKSVSKNFGGILVISLLVAMLFVLFQDNDTILRYVQFFVFPGFLFVLLAGLSYDWFDRKLFARMQNRVGPPFLQPVYDMLKLAAKEDITPEGVDLPEFDLVPPFQVFIAILVALFVPVYSAFGLISFTGDILFIMFLLATIGGSIFILGWASNNPYGLIGASRAAVAEFSFEIPFMLAFAGPIILASSITISDLVNSAYTIPMLIYNVVTGELESIQILYIIPLILLFFIAIISATALLEKVPFDPAHAEVEIVGGWSVEITGKKLLFTRIANFIMEFALAGLIAGVFLGGPVCIIDLQQEIYMIGDWDVVYVILSTIVFIIKTSVIVFLITLMRTLHSRVRIDQMVNAFWKYFLPLALFGIFMILVLLGGL